MAPHVPFLTRRFDLAFQLASGLHHQQVRKGSNVPYIAHLMAVCALVLDTRGDEDQAIAALLHDAVEDQGGLSTLDTIRRLFGERVAEIVKACSDSTSSNPNEKPPWRQRKEAYLQHLTTATPDALLVSAADKLHNARTILADYRAVGEQLWSRFKANKQDQLWYYRSLVAVLQSAGAPTVLVNELGKVVSELLQLAESASRTTVQSRWIGIDFSGDCRMWSSGCGISNVWVAEALESRTGLRLESLRRVQQLDGNGHPFDRLVGLLSRRDFNAAGIDAPFSVPAEFLPAGGHRALLGLVETINRQETNPFPSGQAFKDAVTNGHTLQSPKPYRKTEEYWKNKGVNVRSTLWVEPRGGSAMTSACLALLGRSGCNLWPWVESGPGLLVEAFPAAQLKTWKLPFQKYSGNDSVALNNRKAIVAALSKRIDLNGHESALLSSADALDSVLCAFAGLAVTKCSVHNDGLSRDDEGAIAVHI
jgi:GTP pyrophosphokinase